MSRTPPYAKALHALLKPLGFAREGNAWTRTRDDIWECIDIQSIRYLGLTANVSAKDIRTAGILAGIPCKEELWLAPITVRIGQLIDGCSRVWTDEPDGPAEMAEAVRVHGCLGSIG